MTTKRFWRPCILKMGLEIEMQRVDETGHRVRNLTRQRWGTKENPWITNDFLETMSQIVTPPASNATDAIHYLYSISCPTHGARPGRVVVAVVNAAKWPVIARRSQLPRPVRKRKSTSRSWLKRHSISQGTPSGAHINLSINPCLVKVVFESFPDRFKRRGGRPATYLYQIITQGFVRYRWLLTQRIWGQSDRRAKLF
ncbi:hypothetical protein ACW18Z_06470 [Limosilactobacillus fermentum]